MDERLHVKRVLCPAQYGDILLCVTSSAITNKTNAQVDMHVANEPTDDTATTVVVKQISWTRVQSHQPHDAALQASDDPMLEVDVAARISVAGHHKNIVRYHKVLRGDGDSFGIVMEYCNEGDLLHRLEQLPDNRMSEAEALVVLRQVADGLAFLHDVVGVAHRDVSLENVMVRDGVCKLGDFGLSTRIRTRAELQGARRALAHGRVGKLGYMAPEVAAGHAYDPTAADVWSLGVLFFILLTGSPLVETASLECPAFRAFCRLGVRRVLSDWHLLDLFHSDTVTLCERMLQVDPTQRITLDELKTHAAFSHAVMP